MPSDPPVDPENLKRLHYWSGLALLTAQHLEYGLKLVLWLLSGQGIIQFDPERATDLMEGRAKLTLGQVLKVLGEHVTISEDVAITFQAALDARNRFVHSFLVDHADEIGDPARRDGVIAEIKAIRACMLEGQAIIQAGVRQLISFYGLEFDQLRRDLEDELRAKNAAR